MSIFWGKALELASHVTHPTTVIAMALVITAFLFWLVYRTKPRLAVTLAIIFAVLGISATLADTYLQSRGIYRVQIIALSPDGQPVSDAEVTSSIGGEKKKTADTWELDIPPQVRPASRTITLYAKRPEAYQTGYKTLELGNDYNPSVTIQLAALPAVMIRGVVRNAAGKIVSQAMVSTRGYPDVAVTGPAGNFELPAHAAEGQMIVIHAQKGNMVDDQTVPAGTNVDLVVRNNP